MSRPWTSADLALLEQLITAEQPMPVMQRETGRTANSIRSRLRMMIGRRGSMMPDRPWSKSDVDELLRMHAKGLCFIQVGIRLRRAPRHCQAKYFDLSCGKSPREPVRKLDGFAAVAARNAVVAVEHKTLTARLLGDPLPGRSALDLRVSA